MAMISLVEDVIHFIYLNVTYDINHTTIFSKRHCRLQFTEFLLEDAKVREILDNHTSTFCFVYGECHNTHSCAANLPRMVSRSLQNHLHCQIDILNWIKHINFFFPNYQSGRKG